MNLKEQFSTSSLKTQLTAFFQTEAFHLAVVLHTIAVISSRSSHDWWSVDLRSGPVIHRATEAAYPDYHFPGVLSLQMLTEAELRVLQQEARVEDLGVLTRANYSHHHGTGLEQLPLTALEQLTRLAAALEMHPDMLVNVKRLMRQQL